MGRGLFIYQKLVPLANEMEVLPLQQDGESDDDEDGRGPDDGDILAWCLQLQRRSGTNCTYPCLPPALPLATGS